MTTRLTSFTINDIISDTRRSRHDNDVSIDLISADVRRPPSQLTWTVEDTASATDDEDTDVVSSHLDLQGLVISDKGVRQHNGAEA